MVRQIVAVERTNGFLNAVRLRDDWIGTLRREVQVEDALASVQIEGSSLTLERAFELADGMSQDDESQLPDAEREFVNYLQTFEARRDPHARLPGSTPPVSMAWTSALPTPRRACRSPCLPEGLFSANSAERGV